MDMQQSALCFLWNSLHDIIQSRFYHIYTHGSCASTLVIYARIMQSYGQMLKDSVIYRIPFTLFCGVYHTSQCTYDLDVVVVVLQ